MGTDRRDHRHIVWVTLTAFVILGVGIAIGNLILRDDKEEINHNLLERGWTLYAAHCLSCHGDQNAELVFGMPPSHNAEGHTWHHADVELKNWILSGKPYGMPAFQEKLSEEDVEAILALIKTWWTEDQRKTQAEISRQYEEALRKYKNDR